MYLKWYIIILYCRYCRLIPFFYSDNCFFWQHSKVLRVFVISVILTHYTINRAVHLYSILFKVIKKLKWKILLHVRFIVIYNGQLEFNINTLNTKYKNYGAFLAKLKYVSYCFAVILL